MKEYLRILREVVNTGQIKKTRTGVMTYSVTGMMFQHDLREGFPLLTTKKMAVKSIMVELEGFIKGITDKRWYQERGCRIWDEWCNPRVLSNDTIPRPIGDIADPEKRKAAQLEARDLGPIYGMQWRRFNVPYLSNVPNGSLLKPTTDFGFDQLSVVIDKLKADPFDRRLVVSAWNPLQLDQMALPPCHLLFQLLSDGRHLDLLWYQRSVDVPLGLPFNIASYGTLLKLIAHEVELEARSLTGFLADTHIYANQLDGAIEQLARSPKPLPKLFLTHKGSIFDWSHENINVQGYHPEPTILFPLAV
jgi:thymidylate synthase